MFFLFVTSTAKIQQRQPTKRAPPTRRVQLPCLLLAHAGQRLRKLGQLPLPLLPVVSPPHHRVNRHNSRQEKSLPFFEENCFLKGFLRGRKGAGAGAGAWQRTSVDR